MGPLSKIETGDFVSSPIFCNWDGVKWSLLLYPKGLNYNNQKYLSLYVQCKSNDIVVTAPLKITCECSIRVLNGLFTDPLHFTSEGQMSLPRDDKNTQCWGFPKFINRFENGCAFHLDDIKTIKCVIEFSVFVLKEKECHSLAYKLGHMLEMSDSSDVHFTVKGQIFHAHKNILATRSPVFAAMIKRGDIIENIKDSIIIDDTEPTVFKEVLRFTYTGNVERLKDMVFELAAAASKYRLDGLKVMCEIHLCKTMTKNNVIDILEFAVKYGATELKIIALEFINAHAADVIITEQPKSFCKSDLLLECYDLVMKKIKQL